MTKHLIYLMGTGIGENVFEHKHDAEANYKGDDWR
jgi:hypothetical protein